jgi:ParB family chromosome partitioning protein
MGNHEQTIAGLEALARLIEIAERDTGQSRRVANFLLAWHNAEENGGWDITDLWNVDPSIADDMFAVLQLIRAERRYPDDQGFKDELQRIWQRWRSQG